MQVFEAFIFKSVRKQASEGRFDHLYFGHLVLIIATLFVFVVPMCTDSNIHTLGSICLTFYWFFASFLAKSTPEWWSSSVYRNVRYLAGTWGDNIFKVMGRKWMILAPSSWWVARTTQACIQQSGL